VRWCCGYLAQPIHDQEDEPSTTRYEAGSARRARERRPYRSIGVIRLKSDEQAPPRGTAAPLPISLVAIIVDVWQRSIRGHDEQTPVTSRSVSDGFVFTVDEFIGVGECCRAREAPSSGRFMLS
jgi:hypothetical protein